MSLDIRNISIWFRISFFLSGEPGATGQKGYRGVPGDAGMPGKDGDPGSPGKPGDQLNSIADF